MTSIWIIRLSFTIQLNNECSKENTNVHITQMVFQ